MTVSSKQNTLGYDKKNLIASVCLISVTTSGVTAQSQQDVLDKMMSEVATLPLEEITYFHCYHAHYEDDDPARDTCRPRVEDATRALAADMEAYLPELIRPAFLFEPVEIVRSGGTRFGGVPDVPEGFEWPLSRAFTLADANDHTRLNRSGPETPFPMTFIAQLELSALKGMKHGLPETGRLLFFMDFELYWLDWDRAGLQVIWDQSPIEDLTRATLPDALREMDRVAHREWSGALLTRLFLGSEPFNSGYAPPEMNVRPVLAWQALAPNTLEADETSYYKRVDTENLPDVYWELESAFAWPSERGRAAPFHQLLGIPWPEQDDPRYEAVFQRLTGTTEWYNGGLDTARAEMGLDEESWEAFLEDEARKMVPILQLDQFSFLDINTEGTFYFFLHKDDLNARAFENMTVVYQQT